MVGNARKLQLRLKKGKAYYYIKRNKWLNVLKRSEKAVGEDE